MKVKIYTCLFFSVFLFLTDALSAQKQFKVLLFTRTMGWHHESIKDGVEAFEKMADRHFFDMEWQENAEWFTDEKLKTYDVIVFLNTTGDILNDNQQAAMQRFIQSGKGFVGIHSASDTEYNWEWYTRLVGRMFVSHPAIQTARLHPLNRKFMGMANFQSPHWFTDEWYILSPEKQSGLTYLLEIDESSYFPGNPTKDYPQGGMNGKHPISWFHKYDGGRSFYTAMGHLPGVYQDPVFLDHLFGGLYWAATGKGYNQE
ncbi:MAG: ThuA domain-containing protein [Saprospiraceae bacterium]|nr:ThuA domain-containing protein [Saprospiraceae bacterium]